jgi:hypothetical protein
MKFISAIFPIIVGLSLSAFSHADVVLIQEVGNVPSDKYQSMSSKTLLEENAQKFRSEIDGAVIDRNSVERLRHFTKICSKYLQPGTEFQDLETFLHAAGASAPLTIMKRSVPGVALDQREFFTGIVLYHSFVSSASLLITVHIKNQDSDYKILDQIKCTVIRKSL